MSAATDRADAGSAPPGLVLGTQVLIWQRKTSMALPGVIQSFDPVTKKYQVDYTHKRAGSAIHVSGEWLQARIAEAAAKMAVSTSSVPVAVVGDSSGDGDLDGGDAMSAIRNATFRRLQERHAQREVNKQARKAAAAKKLDPSESPKVFWKDFGERLDAAENMIKQCVDKHTVKLKRAAAKREISAISAAIEEAAELLADASRFLPKYDCRSAQDKIDAMLVKFDDGRAAIFPRQKFSFGARVARQEKGTVASTVVAKMKEQQSQDESVSGGGSGREGHTAAANADVQWTQQANELVFADHHDHGILVGPGQLQVLDAIDGQKQPLVWSGDSIKEPATADSEAAAGAGAERMMDVVLSDMSSCTVVICDVMGGMRLDNLRDCHIYTGPVAGSVFVDQCVGCTFFVAAKQMRIHNTRACTFCVHTQSGPIIEDCSGLGFSFYGLRYPGVDAHFLRASLLRPTQWKDVKDFKWLRDQQSPNWHHLDDAERQKGPRLLADVEDALAAAAKAAAHGESPGEPLISIAQAEVSYVGGGAQPQQQQQATLPEALNASAGAEAGKNSSVGEGVSSGGGGGDSGYGDAVDDGSSSSESEL